jgi:hypothetical protein
MDGGIIVDLPPATEIPRNWVDQSIQTKDGVTYRVWLDSPKMPEWTLQEQLEWVTAISVYVDAVSKLLGPGSSIGLSIMKINSA